MAEVVDIEVDLSHKLSNLQKKLDKLNNKDLSRDIGNLQENVKGNGQSGMKPSQVIWSLSFQAVSCLQMISLHSYFMKVLFV